MASVVTVYSQLASAGSAPRIGRPVADEARRPVRFALGEGEQRKPRPPCSTRRRPGPLLDRGSVRLGQSTLGDSNRDELHAEQHSRVVVLRGAADSGALGGQA